MNNRKPEQPAGLGLLVSLDHWTGPAATFRLSLALVVATCLLLPLPSPETYQVLGLAAILVIYALDVSIVQTTRFESLGANKQAGLVSLLMVAFIGAAGMLFRSPETAWLLLIPAVNAGLRMDGRVLLGVTGVNALAWFALHCVQGLPPLSAVPGLIAGLFPLLVTTAVVRSLRGDIDFAADQLTELSHQDEVSGTLNMRAFTRVIHHAHTRAAVSGTPYSLLMVDIENLQPINDRFGHEHGNRVIAAVADAIKRSVRSDDSVARFGGDEFMVFLSGADKAIAEIVINRIKQNVYNTRLSFDASSQRVQVNIGAVTYPEAGSSYQDVMAEAGRAMYRDKQFAKSTRAGKSGSNDPDAARTQAGLGDLLP